jgi:hypothetical protein
MGSISLGFLCQSSERTGLIPTFNRGPHRAPRAPSEAVLLAPTSRLPGPHFTPPTTPESSLRRQLLPRQWEAFPLTKSLGFTGIDWR